MEQFESHFAPTASLMKDVVEGPLEEVAPY
jgi:hypothetical protein